MRNFLTACTCFSDPHTAASRGANSLASLHLERGNSRVKVSRQRKERRMD